jgi:hypothetical protein
MTNKVLIIILFQNAIFSIDFPKVYWIIIKLNNGFELYIHLVVIS